MIQALRLAKLWVTLSEIKSELDNVAVPLGSHLGIEDPQLMIAMEELSAKIEAHFDKFKLTAELDRAQ
jgi:hypothetical protein